MIVALRDNEIVRNAMLTVQLKTLLERFEGLLIGLHMEKR